MKITTERLELVPLTGEELKLLRFDVNKLEKDLNMKYMGDKIEGFFADIVEAQIDKTVNAKENYIWHTFFLMIRKSDRVCVGSCDYKSEPVDGVVEIGYGHSPQFEGNGYMTETVRALCDLAFKNGVTKVIAETLTDNAKSQNVLKNNGFTIEKKTENLWWKLSIDDFKR